MRRAVCTAATGPHLALFEVTGPPLERYADRHGYEFVVSHERLDWGRPPAWDKVLLLHALVAEYDLVVWVDADALVLDDAPDIASAARANRFLHLVEHRSAAGRTPNTGVLVLRGGRESIRFLERVWAQRRFINDRWWENAAVNHLLGYRHLPYAGGWRVRPSAWRARIGLLDRAWNSIPEDAADHPYIVHFPGIPLHERLRRLEGASVAAVPV
jgi:hypothetical protein